MDNFRVPPSPTWYTPAACTPDNGILYITGNHTSIAYIPALNSDATNDGDAENIQIIQTHNHFKAIVCDPNWQNTKWFVTLNEHNVIWVWNLNTQKVCRGHRAHMKGATDTGAANDSQLGGAMCITKSAQILSIDRNAFVKYCLRSNTYKIFDDNFIVKRGTICILKASPYDENILALGTRNGLITIVNLKESSILHKLRSHDSEIVSLQWTSWKPSLDSQNNVVSGVTERLSKLKVTNPNENAPKREKEKSGREPPRAIVDAGDMFDIHSFDYLEEEFGTITESKKSRENVDDDATTDDRNTATTNENFDFAEACQSLREQIRSNQSDTDGSETNCDTSAVKISDIKNLKLNDADDSLVCSSVHGSDPDVTADVSNGNNLNESKANVELHETEVEPTEAEQAETSTELQTEEEKETVFLASGAQEPFIVIWNVDNGSIHDKIQLKSQPGKSPIPKTNCVVFWIKSDQFIVNGPDGRLSLWKLDPKTSKFIKEDKQYADVAVTSVCSNVDYVDAKPLVWTFSIYLNLVCHQFGDEASEIIANYSTLPIGMFTMRESPHDPNKIAIAGNNKRISILSLSTLKRNTVQIQSLTSRIQSKVIALAWHPTNENLLCFSTNEGRIGIFNVNKSSNPPDLIRNFNGKDVYSLAFGEDPANPSKYLVYATSGNRLMIFNETSLKCDKHQFIAYHAGVSYVCPMANFVAVGLANGELLIFKSGNQKKEIFAEKLSKKYISEISWSAVNKLKLAVGTNENHIFLFEATLGTGDDVPKFCRMGELVGHQSGITSISWSNTSEHRLVSSSFDNTVRVWDARTMECIAWHENENKMFCALFMPSDENFILCSGQSETLYIFDVRKRSIAEIGQYNAKKKKKMASDIQWATVLHQNDVAKLRSQEKNKLRKLERKSASIEPTENAAAVETAIEVTPNVTPTAAAIQLNYTTVLYLTNKELNKEPLKHLEKLLETAPSNSATENSADDCLHVKLFGTRADVHELLMNELKNHQDSRTESIGNVLIPQMDHKLKSHIIESIEAKRLTEQQIALAPSISYEFWKNCCLAFVNQCLDKGLTFPAIPYLLAVHQSTEAIDKLCEANFYREAWCIAKTYKQPEDMIFDQITTNWLKYLEQKGDLEGAALISMLAGKPKNAYDVLNKRKSKTLQIDRILEMLRTKIDSKQ